MEPRYGWTCPGEDAGYCDSIVRKGYEGPCVECPYRVIGIVEEVA